jgi:RNA polymerase sigma factor (sigma-70 family)
MVAANLRLVAHIAGRFQLPPGVPFEDALQAGAIGLMRGAELFDPERGYRLTTFCYWWIRQGISRELDNAGSTIRVPSNVAAAMRGSSHGNCSPEQLAAAGAVWRGCASLDQPGTGSTDGDPRTLAEIIEGGRLEVEQLGQIEQVSQAWAAMEDADPDGCALLQLHHADGANLTELGKLEGCGAVAMRRRLAVATDRLRSLPAVAEAMAG